MVAQWKKKKKKKTWTDAAFEYAMELNYTLMVQLHLTP